MSFWARLLGRLRTATEEALEDDPPAEDAGAVLRESDSFDAAADIGDDTGPTGGTPESTEPR